MILQRLARAIGEQQWFTVFIELIIVVVGIVLGIEVANWSEDRRPRTEERVILSRLLEEATALIGLHQQELEDYKRMNTLGEIQPGADAAAHSARA